MQRKFVDSIRTLKSLRDTYQSQLDISAVTELNAVIAELESIDNHSKSEYKQELGLRALKVIGIVISVVSNIHNWMK